MFGKIKEEREMTTEIKEMTQEERSEMLWRKVRNLKPHEKSALLGYIWARHEAYPKKLEFFLDCAERWFMANGKTNLLECQACLAKFSDCDQTRQQQDEGICPVCGDEDVRSVEMGVK